MAQDSLDIIHGNISVIKAFNYTEQEFKGLGEAIKEFKKEAKIKAGQITSLYEDIKKLTEHNLELDSEHIRVEKLINSLVSEKDDIEGLFNDYLLFLDNLEIFDVTQKDVEEKSESKETYQKSNKKFLEESYELNGLIGKKEEDITTSKKKYSLFNRYGEGRLVEGSLFELENKYHALQNAYGGSVKSLNESISSNSTRKNRLTEQLGSIGLSKELYVNVSYSNAKHQGLKQGINRVQGTIDRIKNKISDLKELRGKVEGKIEAKLETIKRDCDKELPKAPELITDIDFAKRSHNLNKEIKATENSRKNFEGTIRRLTQSSNTIEHALIVRKELLELKPDISINLHLSQVDSHIKETLQTLKEHINKKKVLEIELNKVLENFKEAFQYKGDIFRNLFLNLFNENRKFMLEYGFKALEEAIKSVDAKLEWTKVKIQNIEQKEDVIITNIIDHLLNVYTEIKSIDKNSKIDIYGKREQMLIIDLPDKNYLDQVSLKNHIRWITEECKLQYKSNKSIDDILTRELNTKTLFDKLVDSSKVKINLLKVEPNKVEKLTWEEAVKNSGGEGFLGIFVVFISLLSYRRGGNALKPNDDSKVLIMDNPFGPISSEHLLKPMFDIAKKYNTQLICTAHAKTHEIYDRFDLIYRASVEYVEDADLEFVKAVLLKRQELDASEKEQILTLSRFKVD